MEIKTKKYYDDLVKTAQGSNITLYPILESIEDIVLFIEKEYENSGRDSGFIDGFQEAISYHKEKYPRVSRFGIEDVRRAFRTFITKTLPLENNLDAETTDSTLSHVKLKWVGQNNQLYSVLRQLKNDHKLISNTYDSLVDFLIQNVSGFTPDKRDTYLREIKKSNALPHSKRVGLTVPEPEGEDSENKTSH